MQSKHVYFCVSTSLRTQAGTYRIIRSPALHLRECLEPLRFVAHHTLDLDKLAASALGASGIFANTPKPLNLRTCIVELILTKVGLVVVAGAHVALDLSRKCDAAESGQCQFIKLRQS